MKTCCCCFFFNFFKIYLKFRQWWFRWRHRCHHWICIRLVVDKCLVIFCFGCVEFFHFVGFLHNSPRLKMTLTEHAKHDRSDAEHNGAYVKHIRPFFLSLLKKPITIKSLFIYFFYSKSSVKSNRLKIGANIFKKRNKKLVYFTFLVMTPTI